MRLRSCAIALLVAMLQVWQVVPATGQSITSGDVTGTITDPSGAVIPNATVTLKSTESGATQTRSTNPQGYYRFALVSPGAYNLSVDVPGFQSTQKQVTVAVGQANIVNLQLAVGQASQTVEVSAGGEVVQAENAEVSTTMSPLQVAAVPNPGNDLSYIVQTSPGAVMNTQAGYG